MSELRKIRLKGELGKRFGKVHNLAVDSPAEALRALMVLRPGLKRFLWDSERHGIRYRFLVGRADLCENDLDEFQIKRRKELEFTLIPVIVGCKRGGLFNFIAGVVLIVVGAVANAYGQAWGTGLIKMGFGMLLGGIAQLAMTPGSLTNNNKSPEDKPSYLFNGAVNTVQQGYPIPLLYGRMRVGSATIATALTNQEIPV